MNLGATFGLAAGSIIGALNASKSSPFDYAMFGQGAAWGYVAGAGLGLVIAMVEGPVIVEKYSKLGLPEINTVILTDSKNRPVLGLMFTKRI